MRITVVQFLSPVTATAVFEFFVLGLILMWLYSLGPWIHPANLKVILTFVFRLYRKNKTVDDLSALDISRLFRTRRGEPAFTWIQRIQSSEIYAQVVGSPFYGSLVTGGLFAFLLIALLMVTSHL